MEMNNDTVHVAMASNRRYLPGLMSALYSMQTHASDPDRVVVHVLETDFGEPEKEMVKRFAGKMKVDYRYIDEGEISRFFNVGWNGSVISWARLWLPDMLENQEMCIYSDVDTLWFDDVTALWDSTHRRMKKESKSVYWVRDAASTRISVASWHKTIDPTFDCDLYGNSGIMVMNLARMREVKFANAAVGFVREHGFPHFPDQGVYNALLHRDCGFLDGKWNALEMRRYYKSGCVLHVYSVGKYFGYLTSGELPLTLRPLYRFWFAYYEKMAREMNENVKHNPMPVLARIAIWMIGILYVPRYCIRIMFPFMSSRHVDSLSHFNFYSWMWKKWLR